MLGRRRMGSGDRRDGPIDGFADGVAGLLRSASETLATPFAAQGSELVDVRADRLGHPAWAAHHRTMDCYLHPC